MPVEQIIVVPRNGYANRLQAWASATALGAAWGSPVSLCWEPEPIAPATLDDLFDPTAISTIMNPEQLTPLIGCAHADLPRYLTVFPNRRLITLAGHDQGEQVFMPELTSLVRECADDTTLVIIAGGHFGITDAAEQRKDRHDFYGALSWSPEIDERATALLDQREPFLGLHIRQTDRSLHAPTTRQIESALEHLGERTNLNTVFLAADTPEARRVWQERLVSLGNNTWTAPTHDHARDSRRASIEALVEWRILGHAQGLVYSAQSSFGAEAAVAAGNVPAYPLIASGWQRRSRSIQGLGRAAVTYPKRHGWLNRE